MRAPQYSKDPQSIFKSEFIYNPFPILDSLRKNSPISSIGNSGFHLISSFELIQAHDDSFNVSSFAEELK